MIKRLSLLVTVLVLILVSSFGLSSIAGTGTVQAPVYPRDYNKYQPTLDPTTAGNNNIPVWGHISLDTDVMPNPDPKKPPLADSKSINVVLPIQIVWAAFKDAVPAGSIDSPAYEIDNKDTKATIDVTVLSFKQVTGAGIDPLPVGSTLTLNLTTSLGLNISDVLALGSQNTKLPDSLIPGAGAIFRFTGLYTGTYAAKAVNPKYEMVLKFAVKSIAP